MVVVSQFNGTSTPKGSYRAKTGDNDCNVNSSNYSLSTTLCESIRYQAKSEQNIRQDVIPRVRHGEAALCTPELTDKGRPKSLHHESIALVTESSRANKRPRGLDILLHNFSNGNKLGLCITAM